MAVKFQLRRDTAANWTAANPVLDLGEPGVETDTLKLKIGDGSTPWNSLDYSVIRDFAELANKPTTLAGYGITDAATSAQGALADTALQPGDGLSGAFTGDVTGSVFADDSTLMVDAVNNIVTADVTGNLTGNVTGDVTGNLTGNVTGQVSDLSNHDTDDLTEGTNKYFSTTLVDNHLSGGTGVDYTTGTISIGQAVATTDSVEFVNIKATGYIEGPATFTIDPAAVGDNTGVVVIAGDLQVDGTTTTINSTTLEVDDKNVVLATGSVNKAASDGAGITVDNGSDADATITYSGTNDAWHINKNLGLNYNNPQNNIHVLGTSGSPNVGITLQSHDTANATATLSLLARDASNVNQTVNIQNVKGKLYVDSLVGIGTNDPSYLLDAHTSSGNAQFRLKSGGDLAQIILESTDTSGNSQINFADADSNNVGMLQYFHSDNHMEITVNSAETHRITSSGNLLLNQNTIIGRNTSDGSDNGYLAVVGGGAESDGRGAIIRFYGNEHATEAGNLAVSSGNISGSKISLRAAGNQTAYVTSTGVGIGTDDPDQLLQVYQLGNVGNNYNEGRIKVGGSSSALGLELGYNSSSSGRAVLTSLNTTGGINNRLSLGFGAINSDGEPGTTNVMTLNQAGNVGFGVTQPGHRLHIEADYGATPLVHFDNTGSQETHGPALKVSASGRGVGVKDTSIFAVHNNAEEIFSVRNDGHTFAYNHILNAIDTDISETADDIFIYDTSKDSDGGAWRKRTQHTSWYNETLNTATRGSRKEFPAVAVIVVSNTSDTVTIYDADDPDMPMWMVFSAGSGGMSSRIMVQSNGSDLSCAAMLNGKLVVGRSNDAASYGCPIIDFISEKVVRMDSQADTSEGGVWLGNIADRNSTVGYVSSTGDYDITSSGINKVAMTVLPDAPIDSDTGLPKPTIGVATPGGVSVILNGDTVINKSGGEYVTISDYDGFYMAKSAGDDLSIISWTDTGTTINYTIGSRKYNGNPATGYYPFLYGNGGELLGMSDNHFVHRTGVTGLTIWSENGISDRQSLQANIRHNFNTGWMPGDIQIAALSDTDTSNLTDSNVVSNGTFDASVSGWYGDSEASISWNVGGYADVSTTGDQTYAIAQAGILESGAKYSISFRINPNNSSNVFRIRLGGSSVQWTASNFPASTWTEVTSADIGIVVADGTNLEIGISGGSATAFSIDDIIVRKLEEADRSIKKKNLAVVGNITKSVVATNADLVSYSASGNGSKLETPQANFNLGTNDFCINCWVKYDDSGVEQYLFDYRTPDATSAIFWYINGAGSHQIGATAGSQNISLVLPTNVWTMLTLVRQGSTWTLYENGGIRSEAETGISGAANDLDNGDYNVALLGGVATDLYPFTSELALLRVSKTIPTAEQLAKMYEDEKVLFYTGAQATLYGTTSAVNAFAYDTDTKLLHAGTSDGRSVFQGLLRVDNTTDAVGAAISASNGLVAED